MTYLCVVASALTLFALGVVSVVGPCARVAGAALAKAARYVAAAAAAVKAREQLTDAALVAAMDAMRNREAR